MFLIEALQLGCSLAYKSDPQIRLNLNQITVDVRIDRDQFGKLVKKNPKFSLHAMTAFANRLRAVDRFISARAEYQLLTDEPGDR